MKHKSFLMQGLRAMGVGSLVCAAALFWTGCGQAENEAVLKEAEKTAESAISQSSEEEDVIVSFESLDANGTLTELSDVSFLPDEITGDSKFINAYSLVADEQDPEQEGPVTVVISETPFGMNGGFDKRFKEKTGPILGTRYSCKKEGSDCNVLADGMIVFNPEH